MADTAASSDSRDPASFLSSIIGVPVTVKLNSGVVYKGELQSVDGYMNIALEKCQEFVGGKLRRTYGDAFVRGNNGKNSRNIGGTTILIVCSALHLQRVARFYNIRLRLCCYATGQYHRPPRPG
jgi:U6 snRNA-associated Sm-like protein LSm6